MINKFVRVASLLLLAGCAGTTQHSISESDGRVMLADVQLGESYDAVMGDARTQYSVEPECENRKVSLKKQRKAFIYDICAFTPKRMQYAGAPLSEIVFHFIERSLVRVDVRAEGETALLEKIKSDMQEFFETRGAQEEQLRQGSYQWVATNEVAGVREGGGANAGNVHVRMLDRSLREDAPWLAAE